MMGAWRRGGGSCRLGVECETSWVDGGWARPASPPTPGSGLPGAHGAAETTGEVARLTPRRQPRRGAPTSATGTSYDQASEREREGEEYARTVGRALACGGATFKATHSLLGNRWQGVSGRHGPHCPGALSSISGGVSWSEGWHRESSTTGSAGFGFGRPRGVWLDEGPWVRRLLSRLGRGLSHRAWHACALAGCRRAVAVR